MKEVFSLTPSIQNIIVPLFGTDWTDERRGRLLRENATSLADSVEAVGTGSPGVEETSQSLFTAGALRLVEQLLLKVALFFQLLPEGAAERGERERCGREKIIVTHILGLNSIVKQLYIHHPCTFFFTFIVYRNCKFITRPGLFVIVCRTNRPLSPYTSLPYTAVHCVGEQQTNK